METFMHIAASVFQLIVPAPRKKEEMQKNKDFEMSFDVEKSTENTYEKLIDDLRGKLEFKRLLDIPVLRPFDEPHHWFEVKLYTSKQAVKLKFRSDDLYLVAYQAGSQWFRFDDAPEFPGCTPLGFGGSYIVMQNIVDARREAINLGFNPLMAAVNRLATSTTRKHRAHDLIVIIQMICEAVRFKSISKLLVDEYWENKAPDKTTVLRENGWGSVCQALNQFDQTGTWFNPPTGMNINSKDEALKAIGILKDISSSKKKAAVDGQRPIGRALAEVFCVRIDTINGEDPSQIYGSITVTDGWTSQDIYRREDNDYESVSPGQSVSLTGPSQAISAVDPFAINLSLWNKNSYQSPAETFAQGEIVWNVYDLSNVYDEVQSKQIISEHSSVTVDYVVMRSAGEALVEIILRDVNGEDPANVYGDITAQNGFVEGKSQFFKREYHNSVQVLPQKAIPLLRSVIAVPMDNNLTINAKLWDHGSLSSDKEIVNTSVGFAPQRMALDSRIISGRNGEIEVRVRWN